MRSAHLRPTGWRHPLLCDVSGRILFQKVVWRISVISASLSLNLAQEFVVQSLCAIKWDLRGTEAAKRVWVWTIKYDCNVFYFNFTFWWGVWRHPIRYVTFGILFCQVLNSTQDYIKICTDSHSWISSRSDNILSKMSVYMLGCS